MTQLRHYWFVTGALLLFPGSIIYHTSTRFPAKANAIECPGGNAWSDPTLPARQLKQYLTPYCSTLLVAHFVLL
jgi:hypothetical protein